MVSIALCRPDQPDIIALIDALDAYQTVLYPAESHHGIDINALLAPNVLFAAARNETDEVVACGAIVLRQGCGELKRMFVPPQHRGRGLGHFMLAFLEQHAAAQGCVLIRLETGIHQPEALRLYERAGYRRRTPFGDYREDPNSVFMERSLERVPT
jgi:putative acetyltransferase